MAKRRNVTYEKFNKVIQLIENEGFSLKKACKQVKLDFTTFDSICSEDEEKNNQYTRAKERRTDALFEKMYEIASEPCKDESVTIHDDGRVVTTKFNNVQDKRLRIDTIKWMLGKMQPKKYGDKLDVTTDGKEIKQTPTIVFTSNKNNED